MLRNAAALLILVLNAGFSVAEEPPLNLLVIQTDEHNFRTLGCYRDTLPEEQAFIWGKEAVVDTPHIDAIANAGAICTSFYATSPVCTPSRASFFTGMYPQHTGSPQNDMPMKNEVVTFAKVLQDEGYRTGYAGKWHLDGNGKPQWAPDRKFGFADNRFMFNRGHWKKFELTADGPRVAARSKGKPSYGLADADEKTFSTDWLTDRAIDFIKSNSGKPFCYHLSLPDPHGPNSVRAPYDEMFTNTAIRPPATFAYAKDNPAWAAVGGKNSPKEFRADQMAQYFGMVKCIDYNIGRIRAELTSLGIADRTAIVITSDHGDLCYEHGKLNKGNPYEGSAKVPMILMVPGKVAPGTVVHQALGTVDFMPTILPLLGYEAGVGVQGRDFGSLLQGNDENWEDVTILRNAGLKASWVAAVSDRYKLVISVNEEAWLFDHKVDPDELKNHIARAENKAVAKKLAGNLLSYAELHQDSHITENEEIRSQLISLAK